MDHAQDLPLIVGRTVGRISIDYQFRLLLPADLKAKPLESIEVIIHGPFAYLDETGQRHALDPGDRVALAPALALLGREVAVASVSAMSELRLGFTDGSRISAPPGGPYEAWDISGPGNAELLCGMGGELFEWLG